MYIAKPCRWNYVYDASSNANDSGINDKDYTQDYEY